jgi:glucose-6-phosphate dehydrogenase assembly protein OpcA
VEEKQVSSTPPDIQSELSLISKMQVNQEGVKACLFNLIVYTHEPRRTTYFNELVKIIRTQFPCRIIFIQGNPSSKENYFRIQSKTDCNRNGNGFCCDQILIEAAGQDLSRVYFLLLPLFVPDLPIYLLWGQDPTTEFSILPHLEHFATRLIFDAETTEDLQQYSRDMLNRMTSSSTQIIDMDWARTGGWREVLAQIFDSLERYEQLTSAIDVQIHYNDHPSELFFHPEIQSIYLQAWLASRLEWQFQRAEKENGSQLLYYRSADRNHRIQLIAKKDPNFEAEEILGMEVQGEKGYECHIKRLSVDQVKVQASNQFQCELPFILLMPTLRSGRSFMQEIFYQKTSDHYEPMLKFISLVKWS